MWRARTPRPPPPLGGADATQPASQQNTAVPSPPSWWSGRASRPVGTKPERLYELCKGKSDVNMNDWIVCTVV